MAERISDRTEAELREMLTTCAEVLETEMPDGTLFALLIFATPNFAHFVSNADRTEVAKTLRECANRIEAETQMRFTEGRGG